MKVAIKKKIPYTGYQSDLAKKIKKSPAWVHNKLTGKRKMTALDAVAFEKATGVSWVHFLMPKKYKNPYIKQKDRW